MTHEKKFSCFVTAMMRLITSHEVFITTMSWIVSQNNVWLIWSLRDKFIVGIHMEP
jgi:hypothetical protein